MKERERDMGLERRSVGSQECSGVGIKLSARCRGIASICCGYIRGVALNIIYHPHEAQHGEIMDS